MKRTIRFTRKEKSWILYDWANSVYATNMMAAIFPIYFGSVCKGAGVDNVVPWSYGTAVATFTIAILAPFLGAIGDYKGMKKRLFAFFAALGTVTTLLTALFNSWQMLLVGYVLSYIGFLGSCLLYDSFLTDVTTKERMDKVSAWGYAMGYIGGSTIPFLISIGILLVMGMDNPTAVKIVIVLTSLWWAGFSIPMLRNVKQEHYVEVPPSRLVKNALSNIRETFGSIVKNRGIFLFILAYFCYIDGVNTVINLSSSYGTKLGLDSTGMILALLVTQIVAVPCSILFGRLSERVGSLRMIRVAIGVYFVVCLVGFYMGWNIEANEGSKEAIALSQVLFWIMAFMVGTVQGGIQAISRSYFGKLVPPSRATEYFGFYDIFGKFAAVLGPVFVAVFSSLTGHDSIGVLSLVVLFAVGFVILFAGRKKMEASQLAARSETQEN